MRKAIIYVLAVLVLAAGGVAIFHPSVKFGGQLLTRIGASGTYLNQVLVGTASFLGMNTSQTATSTKPYDLYIKGVQPGDTVFAQLASTSPNGGQNTIGWFIRSCHASTTMNYATCDITNLTGTAAAPSVSAIGSSTQYLVVR